jgi:membrane protein, antimicrobial resistance system
MDAVWDLVRVLFEPTAVFERIRERPKFLVPAIAVGVLFTIVGYLMLPYRLASMAPQMAQVAAQNPNAAAQMEKFQSIGVFLAPIFIILFMVIVAVVLWLLVTLIAGGDAKFKTLLSVVTYTALPAFFLQVAGFLVLKMKGVESVTSPLDLQPPLGLNLLTPNVSGFLVGVLAGINPFTIWGMILTAIGIQVTHRTSKGSAYTVAIIVTVLGLLFAGVGTMLASRGTN